MKKNKSRCYESTNSMISDCFIAFDMEASVFTHDIVKGLTKIFNCDDKEDLEMWIAKNRITGEEYGVTYSSIMDCYHYINTDLRILNKFLKLVEEEKRDLFDTKYNGASIIQCYNKALGRYADGFDF